MRRDHHPCFLRRMDLSRNKARFYILILQPTLFGEMSLVRAGGRIGTRGREKFELFEITYEAAAARSKLAICKAQARTFRHAMARPSKSKAKMAADASGLFMLALRSARRHRRQQTPAKLRTASSSRNNDPAK